MSAKLAWIQMYDYREGALIKLKPEERIISYSEPTCSPELYEAFVLIPLEEEGIQYG